MNKKGFTLVELLAVIVILGLVITIVGTKGFGAFDNTKKAITKQNESAIKEAANVLMTEVKECDEELSKDIIEHFVGKGKTCSDLKAEASKEECLDIRLDYMINNNFITGNGANDVLDLYPDYTVKGCLNNGKTTISLPTSEELDDQSKSHLYVNQNKGNDESDGSKTAPFKTLKKAFAAASNDSKTTIHLLSNYSFSEEDTLTNEKDITLTSNKNTIDFNNEGRASYYIINKKSLNIYNIIFTRGRKIISNYGTLNIKNVNVNNLSGAFINNSNIATIQKTTFENNELTRTQNDNSSISLIINYKKMQFDSCNFNNNIISIDDNNITGDLFKNVSASLIRASGYEVEIKNTEFNNNEIKNVNGTLVDISSYNKNHNIQNVNFKNNKLTISEECNNLISSFPKSTIYSLSSLIFMLNNEETTINDINIENNTITMTNKTYFAFKASLIGINSDKKVLINNLTANNNEVLNNEQYNKYSSVGHLIDVTGEQDETNDFELTINNFILNNNIINGSLLYLYSYKFNIQNLEFNSNKGYDGINIMFNENKNNIINSKFKNNEFAYSVIGAPYGSKGSLLIDENSTICGNVTNPDNKFSLPNKNTISFKKLTNNAVIKDEC